MTLYEFTVVGNGSFPVDMLRYDQCWPAKEATDSVALATSLMRVNSYKDDQRRNVTLIGLRAPTEGRWQSFGWKVEGNVRKMTGR